MPRDVTCVKMLTMVPLGENSEANSASTDAKSAKRRLFKTTSHNRPEYRAPFIATPRMTNTSQIRPTNNALAEKTCSV